MPLTERTPFSVQQYWMNYRTLLVLGYFFCLESVPTYCFSWNLVSLFHSFFGDTCSWNFSEVSSKPCYQMTQIQRIKGTSQSEICFLLSNLCPCGLLFTSDPEPACGTYPGSETLHHSGPISFSLPLFQNCAFSQGIALTMPTNSFG